MMHHWQTTPEELTVLLSDPDVDVNARGPDHIIVGDMRVDGVMQHTTPAADRYGARARLDPRRW